MKTPLRYQATEFDCGPTTMTNAIMYLFDREEIPPDLIRHIGQCTLDSFDDKGHCGRYGTSGASICYFGAWLNELRYAGLLPIQSYFTGGQEVFFGESSPLTKALQEGAAIVLHVYLHGAGHYVLVTGAEAEDYRVFDPYYSDAPVSSDGVIRVGDQPYSHNLLVSRDRLNDNSPGDYSMGSPESREALVMKRYRIDDLYVI
ncbi:MAG: peptidase C39 [Parasporobacterium sp.]|nr:peptidase C39 [Parasporobacterium sp.]